MICLEQCTPCSPNQEAKNSLQNPDAAEKRHHKILEIEQNYKNKNLRWLSPSLRTDLLLVLFGQTVPIFVQWVTGRIHR